MASSSGLVVTSIRRAVLAVVVGGIATAMKATGTANSPTDILLWFLASVLMVVAIDWLVRHGFQYSFRVRKLAGWLPKSFIEGKWVDVGLSGIGDNRSIHSYSYISLEYVDERLTVKGRSWLTEGGEAAGKSWDSDYSEFAKKKLTFWYGDDLARSQHIASRAVYEVSKTRSRVPCEMRGSYTEGGEELKLSVIRLTKEDVREAEKASQTSTPVPANTDRSIKRVLALKDEFDEDFQERLARAYANRVAKKEGLMGRGYKKHEIERVGKDFAVWYRVFLDHCDQKRAEFLLLEECLQELMTHSLIDPSKIVRVLDVGPGNGKLSLHALNILGRDSAHLDYTAVEPNVHLLAELEHTFEHARQKIRSRAIVQRLSEYLSWHDHAPADLIIAFHSLYFCDDFDAEVKRLLLLSKEHAGQGLLLFHTTWSKNDTLGKLINVKRSEPLHDVAVLAPKVAQALGCPAPWSRTGQLTIRFPWLSEQDWMRLEVRDRLSLDARVKDTAELICFLANKSIDDFDQARWKEAVHLMKDEFQTRSKSYNFTLPLSVQYYKF